MGVDDRASTRSGCWRVSGRVQGVGFRWFVQQAARQLGVSGDVCNLPDGRVEIRARGTPDEIEALLERVRLGPRGARVDGVERLAAADAPRTEGFHIRFHA